MATQNFAIVKTRGFHLQNSNGLFVPYGSVLMMADVSGGQVIASRDLSLNSIEVSNRRLTVDASGNIRARSITLKDTSETGETTVVETNGGSISVRDANILVSGEYDVSGNPTSGFVQTVGVKLTDISSESIPVTVLYKDTQEDLVWDGSGTGVLLDAGGIEDISTGVVNISYGIRSLAVDASANGLRLPTGPSDSARMYTCLTALLDIFNSRGIFISYGTAQPNSGGPSSVILFGGIGDNGFMNDTWLWDGNSSTWTKVFDDTASPSPSTSQPSQRSGYGFAYNSITQQFIVFGGYDNNGNLNDTWIFSPSPPTWSQIQSTVSPAARCYSSMVYDSRNNMCVMFGGVTDYGSIFGDTWIFDCATNQWSEVTPATSPSARIGHNIVYDSSNGSVLLFGGTEQINFYSDVWIWDGITWTDVTPVSGPTPSERSFSMMAYSTVQDRFILFGGYTDSGPSAETWSFNNSTKSWTFLGDGLGGIPAIGGGQLQEDTTTGSLILFGINSGWSWNGTTWTQLTANPRPVERNFD